MKNKITLRKAFLVVFFTLQIVGIIAGRFTKAKFFCWAPYDEISFYEIHTTIKGDEMNYGEIHERYRIRKVGRENRSIHNIISIVRQYETTYGKNDRAAVEVSYVTNGHREEKWVWPGDTIVQNN